MAILPGKIRMRIHGRCGAPKHAQYTPPTPTRRNCRVVSSRRRCVHTADATKLFCRVGAGGVNTIRDDCRRIRLTILKLTKQTPQRLVTPILINIGNFFNNDVIVSSLLKTLSVSIKIHVVRHRNRHRHSLFGQFPNCGSNPSAVVVS